MADTTRIESLSVLTTDEGKALLAEQYAGVIENVMKLLISGPLKNQELSGDPEAGTVEAKRFANVTPQEYGTARGAGKGNSITLQPVTIPISNNREIVEELEEKDASLLGVEGLIARRAANHALRMAAELDNAFFQEAYDNSSTVDVSSAASIMEALETVIQECETLQNDFVDGVPRSMMHLVLTPYEYGLIRNDLDTMTRVNVDTTTEEFYAWHGVEVQSCVHLPTACTGGILMVTGAVAEPVLARQYNAEKIPLSDSYALELFYYYGCKAVTPDLIFSFAKYEASTSTGGD